MIKGEKWKVVSPGRTTLRRSAATGKTTATTLMWRVAVRWDGYAAFSNAPQIFHICLPIQDNEGVVTSTTKWSFFCGNGTIFDQQALVCNWPEAAFPCEESPSLFGSVAFGEVLEEDY